MDVFNIGNGITHFLNKRGVRDYLAVLSSRVGVQIVNIVKGFVVAKFLGPTNYGILKSVELITMLDKYGNLGFKSVAMREIPYYRGAGQAQKEQEVRNNAYSSEIVFAFFLLVAGIVSSLFLKTNIWIAVIFLAAFRLFFAKISNILYTEAIIQQRFILLSKLVFGVGLITALLIIITVPFFEIYSVLTVPIIGSVLGIYLYIRDLKIGFRFQIKKKELFRQLKIGIPLTLGTLSFGSYRYAERILVLSTLGLENLGFYGFGTMVMNQLMNVLLTAIKVRKIGIFEKLGQKKFQSVHTQVIKETLILIVGAVIFVILSWIAIDILVPRFLTAYIDAIIIAKVLLIAVPFRVISPYMHVVMVSPTVNKQIILPPLQFAFTVFFIFSVVVLNHFGMCSLINITIVDVIGYALFHISYVYFYKKYFVDKYLKNPIKRKFGE